MFLASNNDLAWSNINEHNASFDFISKFERNTLDPAVGIIDKQLPLVCT